LAESSTEFRVTAVYPCFTRGVANDTHEGYAVTSAPEEWESHPHGNQVIPCPGTIPAHGLSIR